MLGEFSLSDEAELGQKMRRLVRSRFNLIEDPEIAGYIKKIALRLEQAAPPQPFPLSVDVVENSAVNAFATVSSYMVVFSGLILQMESEAELASIMAHELAHITQGHVAGNIERSKIINIGTLIGMLAGALLGSEEGSAVAMGSAAGAQSMILNYSRQDEREADQVGMNYLMEAGYNPEAMLTSMDRMRRMQWFAGREIPSYLSTHPGMDERAGYLEDLLKRMNYDSSGYKDDFGRFERVKTLLRAKYTDPDTALANFEADRSGSCLDYLGKGIVYSRMNKVSQAAENFKLLLECDQKDPLFQREAGIFYFRFNRQENAEQLLSQVAAQRPDDTEARLYYARILAEDGRVSQAVEHLDQALEIRPEDPRLHQHLARIFGRNGNNFMAYLHMAYAHIFANQPEKAAFHRNRAEKLVQGRREQKEMEKLKQAYDEQAEFWDQ
ncbi:MAG: M48 family metalloprotease [Desulfonatronovibrionaceae bacterium]